MEKSNKLISLNAAALILDSSVSVLRKWIANGQLQSYKIGPADNVDIMSRDRRSVKVRQSDILNLIEPVGKTNNRILDTNFKNQYL